MKIREHINKHKEKKENKKNQKIIKKKEKEEQKKMLVEDKKVFKETKDNISIVALSEYGYFKTKAGYMDLFQIESIDIKSMNEVEYNTLILSFTKLLKSYTDDMKIISMNYPSDTSRQQQYLNKIISNCNNENHMRFLEHRLRQLKTIEEKRTNREFFLMIFGRDDKEMINNRYIALTSSRELQVYEIDIDKKIKIIRKLNNMNSKVE